MTTYGNGSGLPDPFMRLTIGSLALHPPVVVQSEASLAEAARAMIKAGASACLVRGESGVEGILTERDVLGSVAGLGADPRGLSASSAMSPRIIAIGTGEPLFEAFAMMVKHAIRRLVVTGEDGEPVGIVGERDLLGVSGANPAHLAREIARAGSGASLAASFAKLRSMALRSVAEGVDADVLGRLISEMHDQFMVRAVQLAEAAGDGPQGPFAVAALGSQGRQEQFLATDLDNAMVLGDGLAAPALSAFTDFAGRFVQTLLAAGFPPCPSRVMADNPAWRRSLRGWEDHVDDLVLAAAPEAILALSMLADLRCVAGDPSLVARVRALVFAKVKGAPVVLKYMAREALRFAPPLGFFGSLALERSGEGKGKLDVKKGGVFPVVQGVRTLALDHGLEEVSTLARIERLSRLGVVSAGLGERLAGAYRHLQTLRLGSQAEAVRAGRVPDNYLDPSGLGQGPRAGRERLKESLRAVAELQALLHGKYALSLMM